MKKLYPLILSLFLALGLGIMTVLALEAALAGWGLKAHVYSPPPDSGRPQMKDFGR